MDSARERAVLTHMREIQHGRALLRMNRLADVCFDACIEDMAVTRQVRSSEDQCICACVKKYLATSLLVGAAFNTHPS